MLINKKFRLAALILALCSLTLTSCGKDENAVSTDEISPDGAIADENENDTENESVYPYTFTDSAGNEVTLSEKPEKVAVLYSSYADIWATAGGEVDITVGEAVERGFADDGIVLVDSGAGHTTIDTETLINSEPDFVIGTTDYECQCDAVEFCLNAGIPAAVFSVENFDDYLSVLDIFCDITGERDRYEEYGTAVGEEIERIKAEALDNGFGEKILFVRAGSSAKSTKAKNSDDTFASHMLSELGGVNIADTNSDLSAELSLEAIVDSDPQYLFITTMGDETAAKDYMTSLLQSEGWRELSCVKGNRYYFLPKELFHFKPNSRWAEAYAYLADILAQNES